MKKYFFLKIELYLDRNILNVIKIIYFIKYFITSIFIIYNFSNIFTITTFFDYKYYINITSM